MRWSNHYNKNDFNRPHIDPNAHNVVVLMDAALAFAICFLFASFAPRELFVAWLSSLLLFAAFFSAASARIRDEPVNASKLTNWDAAATLLLISVVLSWFVDLEAVRAYLEMHGHAKPVSPS